MIHFNSDLIRRLAEAKVSSDGRTVLKVIMSGRPMTIDKLWEKVPTLNYSQVWDCQELQRHSLIELRNDRLKSLIAT